MSGTRIEYNSSFIPEFIKPIYTGFFRMVERFDTPLNITYCFPSQKQIKNVPRVKSGQIFSTAPLPNEYRSTMRKAIASWAEVGNVTITENNVNCDVPIFVGNALGTEAHQATTYTNTHSFHYLRKPTDSFCIIVKPEKIEYVSTSAHQHLFSHEWGHILSLDHGDGQEYFGAAPLRVFTKPFFNSHSSIMNLKEISYKNLVVREITPASFDIPAMHLVYGANTKSKGNSRLNLFNPEWQSTGRNEYTGSTVFDLDGNDILDAAKCYAVDLRTGPQYVSECGSNIVSFAPGTTFENIVANDVSHLTLNSISENVDLRNSQNISLQSTVENAGHDIVIAGPKTKKIDFTFRTNEELTCEYTDFPAQEIAFGDDKISIPAGVTVSCKPGHAVSFSGVSKSEVGERLQLNTQEIVPEPTVITKPVGAPEPQVLQAAKTPTKKPIRSPNQDFYDGCYTFGKAAVLSMVINLGEEAVKGYAEKNNWSKQNTQLVLSTAKFVLDAALTGSLLSGLASRATSYALVRADLLSQKNADMIGAAVGFGVKALQSASPLNFVQQTISTAMYVAYDPLAAAKAFAANSVISGAGSLVGRGLSAGLMMFAGKKTPEKVVAAVAPPVLVQGKSHPRSQVKSRGRGRK
jgi:hypothetical protein